MIFYLVAKIFEWLPVIPIIFGHGSTPIKVVTNIPKPTITQLCAFSPELEETVSLHNDYYDLTYLKSPGCAPSGTFRIARDIIDI